MLSFNKVKYLITILFVNMQGGAPSPLHEFIDTWHNKYVKNKNKKQKYKRIYVSCYIIESQDVVNLCICLEYNAYTRICHDYGL